MSIKRKYLWVAVLCASGATWGVIRLYTWAADRELAARQKMCEGNMALACVVTCEAFRNDMAKQCVDDQDCLRKLKIAYDRCTNDCSFDGLAAQFDGLYFR